MDDHNRQAYLRESRRVWEELAEVHPFTATFAEDSTPESPTLSYPYFDGEEPETYSEEGMYADPVRRSNTRGATAGRTRWARS